ncbi:hypothetical protein [Arsenophonus sp. PmNCSU2021_1]|uniref:hypothetical protein n=1 Tax=Arsenophonus sp. PmNCSU2021_1 TaxID=3118989 RepID=UPI002FEEC369
MSHYNVLKKSFINGRLLYPGETVEYDGVAGNNLELVKSKIPSQSKKTPEKKGDNAQLIEDDTQKSEEVEQELASLRDEYQQLFNKNPHPKSGADKLRSEIDAKRKELGV